MPSSPNFLDLPAEVRRKIYIHADLVRVCPIHFNHEGSRWTYRERSIADSRRLYPHLMTSDYMNTVPNLYCDYRAKKFGQGYADSGPDYEFDYGCMCPPLPNQLLRVCRPVHDEVFHIMYSENKFVLLSHGKVTVSPKAVRKMVSLCVRLNTCSCVLNHPCANPGGKRWAANRTADQNRCPECHLQCRRGSDSPLSEQSITDRDKIYRWQGLCKPLKTNLGSHMRLNIIGDCTNLVMAHQVVRPMERFPNLAECAIRLGQSRDSALLRLAETTVLKLTDPTSASPQSPFRYAELPRELRRQILWHTDLVAGFVLEWNGYGHQRKTERRLRPFEGSHVRCCTRCSDAVEACCCLVNHAAFSSRQCICWRFPAALFTVSKEFKRDATELFYSANRFLIWEFLPQEYHRSDISETLLLLRRMPAYALKHLRWLRFNRRWIPPDIKLYIPTPDPWQQAADIIHRDLMTSKLTIELDCRYYFDDGCGEESQEEEDGRWNSYQTLVSVFESKGPFQDFFVHLASPMEYSLESDLLRLERERLLEKQVMGPDYRAVVRGKYTNRGKGWDEVLRTQNPVYGPDGVRIFSPWPCTWRTAGERLLMEENH